MIEGMPGSDNRSERQTRSILYSHYTNSKQQKYIDFAGTIRFVRSQPGPRHSAGDSALRQRNSAPDPDNNTGKNNGAAMTRFAGRWTTALNTFALTLVLPAIALAQTA